MLTRVFNVAGLIVRLAKWKVLLAALSVKRSIIAIIAQIFAAFVALGGMAVLLGAGFVALEAVIGVSLALTAVGLFLLIVASVIWMVAKKQGKSMVESVSESEVREHDASDEQRLVSQLGITNDEERPKMNEAGTQYRSAAESDSTNNFDNPKVALAAGFAMLGLLGPGRMFRTVRLASSVGSIIALTGRAISNQQHKESTPSRPDANP